ncbi:MAG TPA: Xaa-Pro peptidase family protein [Pyrinomonadaceae bacterium]|nr:Xaa-Pro peptidase family protein [Pyrinomonadaceae bacterium]
MRNYKFKVVNRKLILAIALVISLFPLAVAAQENFNKGEFAARRAKVFEKIGDGVGIVFANEKHRYQLKFRQSPDFFYLTGIEEPDAILILVGARKQAFVFARKKQPWQVNIEGPGVLDRTGAADFYGLTALFPLEEFFTATGGGMSRTTKLYAPLSPPDDLQYSRYEMPSGEAEMINHPLNSTIMRNKQAINKLREWQPQLMLADINPILDDLRWVKSPYEIERMRMSGKIGAEGVREAIKGTKPGKFEYELEAAARFIYVKRGARGDAFTPIVASGPNTMIVHYIDNKRQMQAGDVVLMDYGADYDYYTSDVTRTWAVSGKFTPEQEKMYRCILEVRDAIIAAMKPGVKVSDLKAVAHEVYKKHGFEKEFIASGRYVGHFIGLSVHDVGDGERPFVPGVVYNVEPVIQDANLKIHMRLEDSVLITPTGAENLTAGVPAGLEEVYALQRQKPLEQSK